MNRVWEIYHVEYYTNWVRKEDSEIVTNYEFGCQDNRFRAVGCQITTWECDFIKCQDQEGRGYHVAPGHYFCFIPHNTRNSKCFGPIQDTRYFPNSEARQEAIDTYIKQAKKRFLAAAPVTIK